MSWFKCGACNDKQRIFGKGGGEEVAKLAGGKDGPVSCWPLPMVPAIGSASDVGVPVMSPAAQNPHSDAVMHFTAIAEALKEHMGQEKAQLTTIEFS